MTNHILLQKNYLLIFHSSLSIMSTYKLRKTKRFIKSYNKILLSGKWNTKMQNDLNIVIDSILQGKPTPQKFQDHQLKGDLKEYRECHIRGDLLLVYRIIEDELVLVLTDIGSHSFLSL